MNTDNLTYELVPRPEAWWWNCTTGKWIPAKDALTVVCPEILGDLDIFVACTWHQESWEVTKASTGCMIALPAATAYPSDAAKQGLECIRGLGIKRVKAKIKTTLRKMKQGVHP